MASTSDSLPESPDELESRPGGIPLYVWVLIAVALAVPVGYYFPKSAPVFDIAPTLIMRAIKALAAPLVVLAILHAVVTNEIRGRQGFLMMVYYLINTIVAMGIGLGLTNLIRPGEGAQLGDDGSLAPPMARKNVVDLLTEMVPRQRRRRLRPEQPSPSLS